MLLLYVYTNYIHTNKSSDLWYAVPKIRRDIAVVVLVHARILFSFMNAN